MALFNKKTVTIKKQKVDEICEKINRRRRQILVHSYLYYELDDTLWTDAQFDAAAHELKDLVTKYPEKAKTCVFSEEFKEWDSMPKYYSGCGLPYNSLYTFRIAERLFSHRNKLQQIEDKS